MNSNEVRLCRAKSHVNHHPQYWMYSTIIEWVTIKRSSEEMANCELVDILATADGETWGKCTC